MALGKRNRGLFFSLYIKFTQLKYEEDTMHFTGSHLAVLLVFPQSGVLMGGGL